MIQIRKRRRTLSAIQGYQTHIPTGAKFPSALLNQFYIEDVAGNYDAANFLFAEQRIHVRPGILNGKATAFPVYEYLNYPYLSQGDFSHLPSATIPPSNAFAVTKVAADTNPSKPTVSVPVFLAQLKELPKALKEFGDGKGLILNPKNSAVSHNFGWDQLYRDVGNMFRFTDQVNRRVKQLTAAHGLGGARGREVIWSDTNQLVQSGLTVWSLEAFLTMKDIKTTTRKMWASVRWVADSPGLPPADQILSQARLAVHGWRIAPADVWELIPWSWFVDYFANVGDYLEATQNSLGIHQERGCVMLETLTTHRHETEGGPGAGFTASPAEYAYVTKERTPTSLSLDVYSVPFLGPKQLVTLSSIASQTYPHL